MTDSLKSKALRALSWTFLEAVGLRGTQFVVGVVLARLIDPGQFGLIAMLAIFIAVAESLLDSGFGTALIQKQDATQVDKCSIFYFNVVVGFVAAGVLCLIAPLIAVFYGLPILTPLTRLMSLVLVINAFGLIQNTVLTKSLDFKAITAASLFASVLSGAIGIALAAADFGVGSLVAQQIAYAFFRTVSLWCVNLWRPALAFSVRSLHAMFGYGSRVMATGLLNTFFDNLYFLAIGRLFSATDLGFFWRARKLQELPSRTLSWSVGRVAFPVFSSIRNDPPRLKRALKNALTSLAFVNFPLMIGLLAVARPLVLALLTDKWEPCIVYLQLLCLAGLLFPIDWFNMNVLYALGRSDLCLRLEIVKKVMIVAAISITWWWGIDAIIIGQIVVSVLTFWLNSHYNGRLIGYSTRQQVSDLLPYAVAPVLMGAVVFLVGYVPWSGVALQLVVQICAGVSVYVGLCRVQQLPPFMKAWHAAAGRFAIYVRRT